MISEKTIKALDVLIERKLGSDPERLIRIAVRDNYVKEVFPPKTPRQSMASQLGEYMKSRGDRWEIEHKQGCYFLSRKPEMVSSS